MKKKNRKLIHLAVLAAIGSLSGACGSNNTSQPGVVPAPQIQYGTGVNCPANSYGVYGGQCVQAGSFSQACYYSGGTTVQSGSTTLCRIERATNWMSSYRESNNGTNFPYLRTDLVSGSYAMSSGLRVYAKDKVQLVDDGSEWTNQNGDGWWNGDCDEEKEITLDGMTKSGSQLGDYKGLPQGFVISDGRQVYSLHAGSEVTVSYDGQLWFGINAPIGYCARLKVALKVTHCEDATGKAYSCPN
jgi:hypothetical protein